MLVGEAKPILAGGFRVGRPNNMEASQLSTFVASLIAAAEAVGNGGFFDSLDIETIVAAAVTLLLIASGYYDRRSRNASGGKTCAMCVTPMLNRLEGVLTEIQPILSKHAASVRLHDAVDVERGLTMQKTLDEIKVELHDLRRDLTGRP